MTFFVYFVCVGGELGVVANVFWGRNTRIDLVEHGSHYEEVR